jgi:membrane protein required for colicin V production
MMSGASGIMNSLNDMNAVDTAILVVVVLSCLFGLWRGLVREVLSLLTWVAALVVARVYSAELASYMVNFDNSSASHVAAFALIFVAVIVVGTLLNRLISKMVTITGLQLVDRMLGGLFGVARGGIIVLVIMFITNVFVSDTEQWQQSTLIPYGMVAIEWSQISIGDLSSVYPTQ